MIFFGFSVLIYSAPVPLLSCFFTNGATLSAINWSKGLLGGILFYSLKIPISAAWPLLYEFLLFVAEVVFAVFWTICFCFLALISAELDSNDSDDELDSYSELLDSDSEDESSFLSEEEDSDGVATVISVLFSPYFLSSALRVFKAL